MLGRLEAGIERERRFVDDASHELRTPLALHKTELELALRYGEDEGELRAAIESGVAEVDRLAQLADDLLVVARSGEDGLALNLERIDPAELLSGVATRFGARVRAAGRSIEVRAEPGASIHGDRLRLEQAVTNLVENALRHGAGEIELLASSRQGPSHAMGYGPQRGTGALELHVRDQGDGFPEGFRERAFERFSRADAARASGGAGLGLAIVEAIAIAHGGRAMVGAGTGGADVWLELPLTEGSSP